MKMEECMKLFTKNGKKTLPSQTAELKEAGEGALKKPSLQSNKKYRLTRQMYLFPEQEVSAEINDYLKIGAIVTYLKSGELVEGSKMPWVYVRSENEKKPDMGRGQEGWCFSEYLQTAEDGEACV
jgi:hypothetical protein